MKYKGVIFDLDGTLLDTIEDLADSMNAVLEQRGYPVHNVDSYRYFVGDGVAALVRRALPKELTDEAAISECVTSMREEYIKRMTNKTVPYDGIPEMLDYLCMKGIKIAIVSNKPHPATQLVVADILGKWKFESVMGERPDVPRKPNPTSVLDTARHLELQPEEIIYVGDSGVDMETAINANMFGVGVAWGFRTVKELQDKGAKAVIYKPAELLELL